MKTLLQLPKNGNNDVVMIQANVNSINAIISDIHTYIRKIEER